MKIRSLNKDEKRYLNEALDLLKTQGPNHAWAADALRKMLDRLLWIENDKDV